MTAQLALPEGQFSLASPRRGDVAVSPSDAAFIKHVWRLLAERRCDSSISEDGMDGAGEVLASALDQGLLKPGEIAEATSLLFRIEAFAPQLVDSHRDVGVEPLQRLNAVTTALGALGTKDVVRESVGFCHQLGFAKVLISAVTRSSWIPIAFSIAPELNEDFRDLLNFVSEARFSLTAAERESELVRLQKPYMINGIEMSRRTFKPLLELSKPAGYAAAPLVSRGRVIGMLHADRHDEVVRESDMTMLALVAGQIVTAHEKAEAATRAQEHRARSVQALRSLKAVLESTACSVPDEGPAVSYPLPVANSNLAWSHSRNHLGLTAREQEVLQELATGATNSTIGRHLSVSEETVKSHVKNILHKLSVTTRSEAVARYAQNRRSQERQRT